MYERAEPTVRNKVIVIKASGSGVKRTIKILIVNRNKPITGDRIKYSNS